MVLKNFKSNTELNKGGIIVSSNVHTEASLEPACDTQHTGILITELNACGICASSNVPT